MRWTSRMFAATGILAALAMPVALSTPAQAQHRGFGGFHGGGFHGGGFHHGGFHRGFGFFPGFGIGLGLGALYGGYAYPYYAYPPTTYYAPPAYPYYPPPAYPPPAYPPSYPYYPGGYGASSAGPQYAAGAGYGMPQKTVVREVIREPYPVYVRPRHHRVVVQHRRRFCNCGSHWVQPKPARAPAKWKEGDPVKERRDLKRSALQPA